MRYDGAHKRQHLLIEKLSPFVEWLPVCPEVDIGLGVPRPPIQVEVSAGKRSLVMPSTGENLTEKMNEYARERSSQDDMAELRGYIFKSRSPSCAIDSAPELDEAAPTGLATPQRSRGPGFFTAEMMRRHPELPIAEETALSTPASISAFVEKVCAFDRLANFFSRERSLGQMVMFTSQSRLQLQTHGESATREIDGLLSGSGGIDPEHLIPDFMSLYLKAFDEPATKPGHLRAIGRFLLDARGRVSDRDLELIEASVRRFRDDGEELAPLRNALSSIAEELELPHHIHSTYLEPYRIEIELAAAV